MAAAGKVTAGTPRPLTRAVPAPPVRVRVHDHLGAAAQHVVGDRIHVADDHIGRVARLDQSVGAPVDANQHRLELPDVRAQHVQVGLVVVAPDHDQTVPALHLGGDLGHADTVEQQVALLLEVVHRVGGERLQLHRQALPGVGHRLGHALGVLEAAVCHRIVVQVDGVALDAHRVTLTDPLEDALTEVVEQRDARRDQHLRPEVGVTAGDRRLGVQHRADTDRDERVGGDPVQVDVVEDRDVAGAEPADQPFRAAVQARGAEDLSRFRIPGPAQRG